VCYLLHLASPLTLSEVRAMLPRGLAADLAPPADRQALTRLWPPAATVARLLVGGCSCDLVRPRHPDPREDERELRERYRQLGLPRDDVIRALDAHRRGPSPRREPEGGWPRALAGFVLEHARNAGATLYLLVFHPQLRLGDPPDPSRLVTRHRSEPRDRPDGWLREAVPTVVT
jgi:hypothetical protein